MSEKRNYTASTGKKAGKGFIQGRFFSLDFFKRNAVYYAVKICAGSHYNTLDEDQGPIYNHNKTLVKMQWLDKGQVLKSFNGEKLRLKAR